MQERSKWTKEAPDFKVNDNMSVVIDNQVPLLRWPLGPIVEVLPGTDGRVRVTRVVTHSGIIIRPVMKLVHLYYFCVKSYSKHCC